MLLAIISKFISIIMERDHTKLSRFILIINHNVGIIYLHHMACFLIILKKFEKWIKNLLFLDSLNASSSDEEHLLNTVAM